MVGAFFPLGVSPHPYWKRSSAWNASGARMARNNPIRGAKTLAMARRSNLRWPAGRQARQQKPSKDAGVYRFLLRAEYREMSARIEKRFFLGCVAKIEETTRSSFDGTGVVRSGGEAEYPIDEVILRSDVTRLHPPDMALLNLVHHLVTLNRSPRRTELPEILLGTDLFLMAR